MRLSHKALAAVGVVAGLGIGGSLIYALRPVGQHQAKELYSTDNRPTADVITAAPKDYGHVPKLGPPLPGDLGPPILSAEQRREAALGTPGATPAGPGAQANAAAEARQRVLQERDAARKSKLFLGGETAPAAASALALAGQPAATSPSAAPATQP